MNILSTILLYLCIPLFGNGIYFLVFGSDGPECGPTCLLFFNIAFICLFLPFLFGKVKDSGFLNGGLNVLATTYMIVEAIIMFLFICYDGSKTSALVVQGLLLGIFLICFFRMSTTNDATDRQLREESASQSQDMIQARVNLQLALNATKDSRMRENIRTLIAEINSMPIQSTPSTRTIERLILDKTSLISVDSSKDDFDSISSLLSQRKLLIFK